MFQYPQGGSDQFQNVQPQQGSICIPAGCIIMTNDPQQQIIGSPQLSASPQPTSPIQPASPRFSLSPQPSFVDPNGNYILTNGFPINGGSFVIGPGFNNNSGSLIYIQGGDQNQNQNQRGSLIINRQSSLMVNSPPPINASNFGVTSNSPTALLSPEEITKACMDIKDGIDAISTDEGKLISSLGKYAPNQMDQIIGAYEMINGNNLESVIKNATSGNFGKLCTALSKTVLDYDVWCLHNAIEGIGTDEDCLIDILVGRTNNDIMIMNKVYKETYNKSLEDDVRGDTSGNFRALLIALLQANREENSV